MLNHVGLEKKIRQAVQGRCQCDVEEAQPNEKGISAPARETLWKLPLKDSKAAPVDARHQEDRKSQEWLKGPRTIPGPDLLHASSAFSTDRWPEAGHIPAPSLQKEAHFQDEAYAGRRPAP